MCTRRQFLYLGVAATLTPEHNARSQVFPLSIVLAAKAGGCGYDGSVPETYAQLKTCGVPEIDKGVVFERPFLNRAFDTAPDFYFFDDKNQPQAFAKQTSGETDIYFGSRLATKEKSDNPYFWGSAIVGIMAHEWAHAFQFSSGLHEITFIQETHADFMAGWYLGLHYELANPYVFASSLYSKSSNNLTGFFSPDMYGSPEQRVHSMLQGFSIGKERREKRLSSNLLESANLGYDYVLQLEKKK